MAQFQKNVPRYKIFKTLNISLSFHRRLRLRWTGSKIDIGYGISLGPRALKTAKAQNGLRQSEKTGNQNFIFFFGKHGLHILWTKRQRFSLTCCNCSVLKSASLIVQGSIIFHLNSEKLALMERSHQS